VATAHSWISKHKQAQAQAKMLTYEFNHRVKNTLSTVQSSLWQAFLQLSDTAGRLFALSQSHDLLARENWESAGLVDIVKEALDPFGVANGRAERFVIAGSNIRPPTKATLALGIALHELATNATKLVRFPMIGVQSSSDGGLTRRRRAIDSFCIGRRRAGHHSWPGDKATRTQRENGGHGAAH
jgi:HWE histidine kinase